MNLRIFYLCIVLLCSWVCVQGQSYKRFVNLEAYRHHLSYPDHQVSFFTLPADERPVRAKLGREYFWLAGRQLNATIGGYSGKLLHGQFNSFYLNKQLKEEGFFRKGLKSGEWKQWYENGRLALRITYLDGVASGRFYKYNENGLLVEEGSYVAGRIDGRLKKYISPDSVKVLRYRNGMEYQQHESKPWWKYWKRQKKV